MTPLTIRAITTVITIWIGFVWFRQFILSTPISPLTRSLPSSSFNTSSSLLTQAELAIAQLPWDEWLSRVTLDKRGAALLPKDALAIYLETLRPFLEYEAITSCGTPPPPLALPSIDCIHPPPQLTGLLTGAFRSPPAKLYDTFVFAYEFQVLEMRLFELEGIVDTFALMESSSTHRRISKPLFFARHREQYQRFLSSIIHLIADPSEWGALGEFDGGRDDWLIENRQRGLLLTKLINALPPNTLKPYDLIIHGDTDEIPQREILAHLKYCETNTLPIKFSGDNYLFNFHTVLDPHPILFPILSMFSQTEQQGALRYPLRHQQLGMWKSTGSHASYHLSGFGGTITQIFKNLALAEGGQIPRNNVRFLRDLHYAEDIMLNKHERICCESSHNTLEPNENHIPWYARLKKLY